MPYSADAKSLIRGKPPMAFGLPACTYHDTAPASDASGKAYWSPCPRSPAEIGEIQLNFRRRRAWVSTGRSSTSLGGSSLTAVARHPPSQCLHYSISDLIRHRFWARSLTKEISHKFEHTVSTHCDSRALGKSGYKKVLGYNSALFTP